VTIHISDVLWNAGIALVGTALSWGIGWAFARWGRGPALFVRVLACGPIGLIALAFPQHGFGGRHGLPVEILYVPAALYPLIASEADRAIGLRVLVLGELAALGGVSVGAERLPGGPKLSTPSDTMRLPATPLGGPWVVI
jgi:hypothetical protein